MKSEQETLEFIETGSEQRKMTPAKQQEIWNKIQNNMSDTRKLKRKSGERFFNRWKTVSVIGLSLLILGLGITYLPNLTGQLTFGASSPDYSILKNVSPAKVSVIKKVIRKESIKGLELPTKLPYSITSANYTPDSLRKHYIDIYLGNQSQGRVLEIAAWTNLTKKPISRKNVIFMDEKVTQLSDGTKALYGNNGHVSQLAWDKDGVRYIISSTSISPTHTQNKSDLTEKQLIQVADSFK